MSWSPGPGHQWCHGSAPGPCFSAWGTVSWVAGASIVSLVMSATWLASDSRLCHPSCPVPGHPSSVGDGRILPGDPPAGAQLAASRDPTSTPRGSCGSAATWHSPPQLLGSPASPAQGVLAPPAGANSLPCSFSPGVSAEPAGRPGKQIHRQPPQPKTSTKQGGDRSGGPPQPCPPLPWATPEPWAPPSHRHAPNPRAGHPVPWASPPSSLLAQHPPATGLASPLSFSH